MVTEAVYRHTQFKRFIGVCNVPIGMKSFVCNALKLGADDDLSIDIFGLNHMVFLKDVWVNGQSRFAELLDGVVEGLLEGSTVKNIDSLTFNPNLIRALNLLPCAYLRYYFKHKEMLAIEMGNFIKWRSCTSRAGIREKII